MGRPFDFSPGTKSKAFFRQWNLCAHCGESLEDMYDHAHHVVPNQVGRAGAADDAWIKEVDNCVILCEDCHTRVHEDGRFQAGAVAPPDYYPYSHGHQAASHQAWFIAMRRRFWT
jgi:hypothetical protein